MPQILEGNPKNQDKLAAMLAQGMSQAAIARKMDANPMTINKWANREEIRAKIEEAAARMVEQLPRVARINQSVLVAGERESAKLEAGEEADKQVIDMAVKVGDKIGAAVGIQASHTGSTVINNILIDNSQNVVIPSVQELLGRMIDITPTTTCSDVGE